MSEHLQICVICFLANSFSFERGPMNYRIVIFLISLFAVSCVDLNGQLTVLQTMKVNKLVRVIHLKSKKIDLDPAVYTAALEIKDERNFLLKLKTAKKDLFIPLKSDSPLNFPTNGLIRVSGSDISQPFNLKGTLSTEYSDSETNQSTEGCTYSRVENRCEKNCRSSLLKSRRPIVDCQTVCRNIPVPVSGQRIVEYHFHTTKRILDLEFLDLVSFAQLAILNVEGSESEKINDSYGECR
jgi:hypothetical protein